MNGSHLDLVQDRPLPPQSHRGSTPSLRGQSKIDSCKKIQRSIVKQHCFRTTATTALEVELGLMPASLHLQSKILSAYTHLITLPQNNPVNPILMRATTSPSPIFISPLEYLTKTFPDYSPSMMETIQPYIHPL
jgi:hypothetical protein